MAKGPKLEFPVTGIRVVLDDGAAHSVDSSEMAFQAAARIVDLENGPAVGKNRQWFVLPEREGRTIPYEEGHALFMHHTLSVPDRCDHIVISVLQLGRIDGEAVSSRAVLYGRRVRGCCAVQHTVPDQGQARPGNMFRLEIISNLKCQWKPWLLLTAPL